MCNVWDTWAEWPVLVMITSDRYDNDIITHFAHQFFYLNFGLKLYVNLLRLAAKQQNIQRTLVEYWKKKEKQSYHKWDAPQNCIHYDVWSFDGFVLGFLTSFFFFLLRVEWVSFISVCLRAIFVAVRRWVWFLLRRLQNLPNNVALIVLLNIHFG